MAGSPAFHPAFHSSGHDIDTCDWTMSPLLHVHKYNGIGKPVRLMNFHDSEDGTTSES